MAYQNTERESELIEALKAEEDWASSYLKSELQEAQIDALRRYYGEEYGDEVDGRSRVTTREVYEVIQWLRPDLRRTFTAGDQVFEFEGVTQAADQHAEAASDYINWLFLNENDGERELDAFIFDGLLQRVGLMGCEWREAEYSPAQEVSGLNQMQAEALMADPMTEIVEQEVRQDAPDEAHPDGAFFDFKIRRIAKHAGPEIFAIAPEDFRIAARTVDLETARYAGDIVRMMRGEAKKKWPRYAEEIDSYQGDTAGFNTDERRAERFRDLEGWDAGTLREHGSESEADEVEIMREYIRHDLDGDGVAELLRCYRLNDCLLEYEEVDEHIYSHWTPNPVPHRFFGLSIADEAIPLQRTKTVLTRSFLDAINFAVVPRTYANRKMISERGLDALLTVRPGVIIEGEGVAGEALQPLVTPDVSQPALTGMQWVDRMLESRTGVNRSAQPMDPDLLHDTAKGVELLQNAASVRKEEIARNLAVGLQALGMKLYRLVHKHQDQARSVKIAGQWQNIDPRAWEAEMRCTVSVGLGTGAREKQLVMLQMIQADQVAAYQAFGPGNPVVTIEHMHNLVAEKLRVMGFKTPDKFFGEPIDPQTGQMFVPQPPPNPDMQKVQAQIQEGQARLKLDAQGAQQKAQLQQFETQAKVQSDQQKAELDAANDARKAANDAEIARAEMEGRLEIAEREMQAKITMQQQQMAFEAQMKQAQFEFEMRMAEREFELKERMAEKQAAAKANGSVNGAGVSGTRFGGEPG